MFWIIRPNSIELQRRMDSLIYFFKTIPVISFHWNDRLKKSCQWVDFSWNQLWCRLNWILKHKWREIFTRSTDKFRIISAFYFASWISKRSGTLPTKKKRKYHETCDKKTFEIDSKTEMSLSYKIKLTRIQKIHWN